MTSENPRINVPRLVAALIVCVGAVVVAFSLPRGDGSVDAKAMVMQCATSVVAEEVVADLSDEELEELRIDCPAPIPNITDTPAEQAALQVIVDDLPRPDTGDSWCDNNFHQNVSCSLNGQITVPIEVRELNELRHIEWCESIYHRNVGCPKHGEVLTPVGELVEREIHHREWCDSIMHRNVGCPNHEANNG